MAGLDPIGIRIRRWDFITSPLPLGEVAAKRRVRVVPHRQTIGFAALPSPGTLTRSDLSQRER
jgi:hypothetical protein